MRNIFFRALLLISPSLLAQLYQPENLLIDNNQNDQHETAIAVDSNDINHFMVTWNDFRPGQGQYVPGFAFSTNGGTNWFSDVFPIPGFSSGCDPSCGFDRNGYAYYLNLALYFGDWSVYISKSTDNGLSWNFRLVSPSQCDKPYMTIDNTGGDFDGRIYAVYTRTPTAGIDYKLEFRYSTDQGETWSDETELAIFSSEGKSLPHFMHEESSTLTSKAIGAIPIVAPNGYLYITYLFFEEGTESFEGFIKFRKSTDGGATFSSDVTAAEDFGLSWFTYVGSLRASSDPTITVTPDGIIYIAFNQLIDESDLNIYYIKSTDEGTSWSEPVVATESTYDHQLFPWLTCSPEGTVYLNYYQGNENSVDFYLAELFNGQDSFYTPNFKITNVSSNPSDVVNSNRYSDYIGNFALSKNLVFPVWPDFRNEHDANIHFSKYETDLRFAYENKSLDHTATSLNGQRKLAKDSNGNYHIVFASNGEIFTRKSTNNGNSWQAPVRLSDGTGENKFPSITTMDNYLYITWQQYLGLDGSQHKYKIKGMYTSMTGWSPMTINDDEVYFSSPTDPLPVIVAAENIDNNYSSTDGLPEVMIAYRNSDGIYHINLFAWTPDSQIYYYSQQGSVHKIPNTSSGYRNPSITANGLGEIMLTCDYMGNIYAF